LCFGAIIILSFYIAKKKIFKWGFDSQSLDKLLKKSVVENIANIKEIKLYRRKSFFLFLLTKLNFSLSSIDLKIDVTQQLPRLLIEVTAVTFLCLIIFLNLGTSSKAEIITILVAYSAVILRLMPASTRVSAALQRLKFYSSQINILSKELKFKSSVFFLKNEKNYDSSLNIKSFRIMKIDFSYKNSDNLIKNLNLLLKKGTINCIVGSNGSGKSTLINIILGLLEPDKGKILINNSEKLYKHFKYRYNKIGYVSQNIYLLDDSIKNNIIFGNKNLDLSRLNMSINMSGLNKLILSLPNKLETLVGERGTKLSGGQVQKIALARCFYHNPDFLVLDEFNNNLDLDSEAKVLNYLEKIKENKIIIIISHKKEVLKFCDNIYKFKNKKLIKL
jgi:ABC-type bacteriocin/lantibiotic exporter with double-glycine peptidase domain